MLNFGIATLITDSSIRAVELARWAEANNFESLFMGAHSHIPTSRRTPFPVAGHSQSTTSILLTRSLN
jgi:hypothetical protein